MSEEKEKFTFDFEPAVATGEATNNAAKPSPDAATQQSPSTMTVNTKLLDALAKRDYSQAVVHRDDPVEVERLKTMIARYKNSRFGHYLLGCGIKNYGTCESLNQESLAELLEKIKYYVRIKSMGNIGTEVVLQACGFAEAMVKHKLPLVAGLTGELRKDEMFLDGVEEIALQNFDVSIQCPKKKVGFSVLRCLGKVQQTAYATAAATQQQPQVVSGADGDGCVDLAKAPQGPPPRV